jgi:hypothetical protein
VNSGLINGPVQAQKNGRWRRWESTLPSTPFDPSTGLPSTALPSISTIVPVPSFVSVVRVSAVAGTFATGGNSSGSGAACKNILLTVSRGKRLSVAQSYDGGVRIGVLTPAGELATAIASTIYDISVHLEPGVTSGGAQAGGAATARYVNGNAIATAGSTTTVPNAVPFLGGTLVSGFGGSTAASPVNPQIRQSNSGLYAPSHLFGGPLVIDNAAVPGAFYVFSVATNVAQPSYVLVEWME